MTSKIALCFLIVVLSAAAASSQTRRRTTGATNAKAEAVKATRAAAERITAQSKLLATFLYRYGAVAEGVRLAEKQANENSAPPEVHEMIRKNKDSAAATVRNLVGGMQDLERYLGLSPATKPYFVAVNGLSQDIDLAADTAEKGDLGGAAEQLLTVLDHLNSALLPPAPPR